MRTYVRAYDPETRTMPVTFSHAGVTHRRDVNAVLNDQGEYDREATRSRIADVANGVQAKIESGVLR